MMLDSVGSSSASSLLVYKSIWCQNVFLEFYTVFSQYFVLKKKEP